MLAPASCCARATTADTSVCRQLSLEHNTTPSNSLGAFLWAVDEDGVAGNVRKVTFALALHRRSLDPVQRAGQAVQSGCAAEEQLVLPAPDLL